MAHVDASTDRRDPIFENISADVDADGQLVIRYPKFRGFELDHDRLGETAALFAPHAPDFQTAVRLAIHSQIAAFLGKRDLMRGLEAPAHDCNENAVPYESDGALGHGWECGRCGRFLQAG